MSRFPPVPEYKYGSPKTNSPNFTSFVPLNACGTQPPVKLLTWVPRLTTYPFPFQVSAAFFVVVGQLVGFCFVLFFDFQNFSVMVENNDNMV